MPINEKGVWKRRVNWAETGKGRTDIQSRTLNNQKFNQAEFIFKTGETVVIAADEMRRALTGCKTRNDGKTVGPYNIDVNKRTVNDVEVTMEVISSQGDVLFEPGHVQPSKKEAPQVELVSTDLNTVVDLSLHVSAILKEIRESHKNAVPFDQEVIEKSLEQSVESLSVLFKQFGVSTQEENEKKLLQEKEAAHAIERKSFQSEIKKLKDKISEQSYEIESLRTENESLRAELKALEGNQKAAEPEVVLPFPPEVSEETEELLEDWVEQYDEVSLASITLDLGVYGFAMGDFVAGDLSSWKSFYKSLLIFLADALPAKFNLLPDQKFAQGSASKLRLFSYSSKGLYEATTVSTMVYAETEESRLSPEDMSKSLTNVFEFLDISPEDLRIFCIPAVEEEEEPNEVEIIVDDEEVVSDEEESLVFSIEEIEGFLFGHSPKDLSFDKLSNAVAIDFFVNVDDSTIDKFYLSLNSLAETDEAKAHYYLGLLWYLGLGVDESPVHALSHFLQAGDKITEALVPISMIFESNNNAFPLSPEQARMAYSTVVDFNWPLKLSDALLNFRFKLAECYEKGIGCEVDLLKATEFYGEAIWQNKGDDELAFNVGAYDAVIRLAGEGVSKAKEFLWYKSCYINGAVISVNQHDFWLQKVADAGIAGPLYEYAMRCEKDAPEESLTYSEKFLSIVAGNQLSEILLKELFQNYAECVYGVVESLEILKSKGHENASEILKKYYSGLLSLVKYLENNERQERADKLRQLLESLGIDFGTKPVLEAPVSKEVDCLNWGLAHDCHENSVLMSKEILTELLNVEPGCAMEINRGKTVAVMVLPNYIWIERMNKRDAKVEISLHGEPDKFRHFCNIGLFEYFGTGQNGYTRIRISDDAGLKELLPLIKQAVKNKKGI